MSPELQILVESSPKRVYKKGLMIIQEGDVSDTLYVLLAGRVRVYSANIDGREMIFGDYGQGEMFGEMSLDGGPRSASVLTVELSECAVVSKRILTAHIEKYPQFAFEVIARVIQRARLATDSAKNLALLDVYGRLKIFLEQAPYEQTDSGRVLTHKYTHQNIAQRVGASREMVSRILKDLENGGFLASVARSGIKIIRLPEKW